MTTLPRLLAVAVAIAGFTTTASAQYQYQPYTQPQAPQYRNPFPPNYPTPPVVVKKPLFIEQPVLVQRPVFVERPVLVPAPRQVPLYCLDTFARDFHPCPGKHHIAIVHPVTKQPVEVCFTLPECKLRDLDVCRRHIGFDYGKHEVRIEFKRDGTVCVHDD